MDTYSVSEFQAYCMEHGLHRFVYDTENQETHGPMLATARLDRIAFSLAPDRILLRGGGVTLQFPSVREVQVEPFRPCVGTVCRVICEQDGAEHTYTLLAD